MAGQLLIRLCHGCGQLGGVHDVSEGRTSLAGRPAQALYQVPG